MSTQITVGQTYAMKNAAEVVVTKAGPKRVHIRSVSTTRGVHFTTTYSREWFLANIKSA